VTTRRPPSQPPGAGTACALACLVGIMAVLGVGCWALTTQFCPEQTGPAVASPSGHYQVRTVVRLCGGAAGASYTDDRGRRPR
jgi:hypothetical protein